MNRQIRDQMHEIDTTFMDVATRKFEEQDEKIFLLEENINRLQFNTDLLKNITNSIESLRKETKPGQFTKDRQDEICRHLEHVISEFQKPARTIIRHHHISKNIWITIGLFLLLTLACSRWYHTSTRLDDYVESDTKYRYLRLDKENIWLQSVLQYTDSLYKAHSDMRNRVLDIEKKKRLNLKIRREQNLSK